MIVFVTLLLLASFGSITWGTAILLMIAGFVDAMINVAWTMYTKIKGQDT